MLFVHVLARILNFILHTYYIRVSIISSAVQHVPWTLDFRPSAVTLDSTRAPAGINLINSGSIMSSGRAVKARFAFIWATQMVASVSWFVACMIYNSYEHGDIWQVVGVF